VDNLDAVVREDSGIFIVAKLKIAKKRKNFAILPKIISKKFCRLLKSSYLCIRILFFIHIKSL